MLMPAVELVADCQGREAAQRTLDRQTADRQRDCLFSLNNKSYRQAAEDSFDEVERDQEVLVRHVILLPLPCHLPSRSHSHPT